MSDEFPELERLGLSEPDDGVLESRAIACASEYYPLQHGTKNLLWDTLNNQECVFTNAGSKRMYKIRKDNAGASKAGARSPASGMPSSSKKTGECVQSLHNVCHLITQ